MTGKGKCEGYCQGRGNVRNIAREGEMGYLFLSKAFVDKQEDVAVVTKRRNHKIRNITLAHNWEGAA